METEGLFTLCLKTKQTKSCVGPPPMVQLFTNSRLDWTVGKAETQPSVWQHRHGLRGENLQVIAE